MSMSNFPKILYQDEHYLAVEKPAGLSTQPTQDPKRPSLLSWVGESDSKLLSATVAHRLDVETSGVILFAKTREARQCLDQLFKQHLIRKTYYAVAYANRRGEKHGKWQDYLKERVHNKLSRMEIVSKGGDVAITEFEIIDEGIGLDLIRFRPQTGRKHQIRAQAAFHGLPLVGDELYGPFKKDQGLPSVRHYLHAAALEFVDPINQTSIKIESSVPQDFYDVLRKGLHNKYLVLNKPYDVLSQFTGNEGEKTLAEMGLPGDVWPVGRLDKRSEGLLLLTNDRLWRHDIMSPESHKSKIYWVLVDGRPNESELDTLQSGPTFHGRKARECEVRVLTDIEMKSAVMSAHNSNVPVRERKNIPTTWLEIILHEGKNHQVRHMTAAIGHPTLRLIRVGYGQFKPGDLLPGEWRALTPREVILLGQSVPHP
ncbi:MAG: pseudouridine synthase [Bdellovibrio sp.]|nr:pseudouridine synthase [Bdellovibrio sp.]